MKGNLEKIKETGEWGEGDVEGGGQRRMSKRKTMNNYFPHPGWGRYT